MAWHSQQTPYDLYHRSVYQMSTKLDGFAQGRRSSHWLGQTERRYDNHMRAQPDRRAEWHAQPGSQDRQDLDCGSIKRLPSQKCN